MFDDSAIEIAALGIYLVILLGIGITSARRIHTATDFALAGRQVGWLVLLATTAATMLGGGSSIGSVGNVYKVGIAAAVIVCAWHLQLIFTGLFVAPRLRGLNLITVGDFFELKFGVLARDFSTFHCVIFLIGAAAAQMVGMGTIMTAVLGIDYGVALLIASAITVFYSTVGGMRAVVKTDVLQFVILIFGLGTAAFMLFSRYGGFTGIAEHVGDAPFELTSQWTSVHLIGLFFAFLLGETFIPPYTTRCFIARDAKQSRWGVAGAGLFLLLFHPIVIFILGLSAHIDPAVNGQSAGNVQLALPSIVRMLFHPVLSGVMIAALMAAVMSSADSCLASLSSIAMEDVYRRHVDLSASDSQLLGVARWTTCIAGIGSAICAYFFDDIIKALEFIYDFWAPGMVVPFIVGVFWYDRSRVYAVVASMTAGTIATVGWRFLLGSPWQLSPALFGFVVAAVTLVVALPLTSRRPLRPLFEPQDQVYHS